MEVLGCNRLIVRQVRPNEDDQIGTDPVGVRAGGPGTANCRIQSRGTRRMTDASAGIDMIGADEPAIF